MLDKKIERIKRAVIRKYPIFASIALLNVPITEDNSIDTAAVWGEKDESGKIILKGIIYNSEFLDSLTFDEQVFVLAHETCHIAFKHFLRSADMPLKDIERKYQEYCSKVTDENLRRLEKIRLHQKYNNIWNIATDACINAFLKKDGLMIPNGVIDKRTGQPMQFIEIEDGLYRSAEAIYDDLVKKEDEKEQEKSNQQNSNNDNRDSGEQTSSDLDNIDIDNYQGIDSHDKWIREPVEKENEAEVENGDEQATLDESSIFEKNEEVRNSSSSSVTGTLKEIATKANLPDIKPARPVLSWKHLLQLYLDEEEQMWSYRRSSRYSPNARIGDISSESRAISEVLLDTSGSVPESLLKSFLSQLMSLRQDSDIRVGCFGGKFHGFTEIKTKEQVENFTVIRDNGGTNFELAVNSFSKDNEHQKYNKIVFTDGQLDSVSSHVQKTKVDGILWIVFGNKMDFKPVSGRVIRVSNEELYHMINGNEDYDDFEEYNIKSRRR